MAEITAEDTLQLKVLDLLQEPRSIWDLLHDENLHGIDPKKIGETLKKLHTQLRLKVYMQTLDGLFASVKLNVTKLFNQLDCTNEPDSMQKYWVQKEHET